MLGLKVSHFPKRFSFTTSLKGLFFKQLNGQSKKRNASRYLPTREGVKVGGSSKNSPTREKIDSRTQSLKAANT